MGNPNLVDAPEWEYEVADGLFQRGVNLQLEGKPTIHFMHGTGFSGKLYWPCLKGFINDYGVFMPDMHGHGDSDNGDSFPGYQEVIARDLRIIEHLSIKQDNAPLFGMGHSYGGALSLIMAAQNPGLFDGLVLLDAALSDEQAIRDKLPPDQDPHVRKALGRKSQWPKRENAKRFFQNRPDFQHWTEEAMENYLTHAFDTNKKGEVSLKCPAPIQAGVYADKLDALWDAVRSIQTPTTLLYGSNTNPAFITNSQLAAEMNPNINAIEVNGSHNFMQEFPEETFNAAEQALQQYGK